MEFDSEDFKDLELDELQLGAMSFEQPQNETEELLSPVKDVQLDLSVNEDSDLQAVTVPTKMALGFEEKSIFDTLDLSITGMGFDDKA
jgi:hypothetical protein